MEWQQSPISPCSASTDRHSRRSGPRSPVRQTQPYRISRQRVCWRGGSGLRHAARLPVAGAADAHADRIGRELPLEPLAGHGERLLAAISGAARSPVLLRPSRVSGGAGGAARFSAARCGGQTGCEDSFRSLAEERHQRHSKLLASFVLPLPLYCAFRGNGQRGCVRSRAPSTTLDAMILSGATPCSTHRSRALSRS